MRNRRRLICALSLWVHETLSNSWVRTFQGVVMSYVVSCADAFEPNSINPFIRAQQRSSGSAGQNVEKGAALICIFAM